jgi:hypothetical protein
MDQPLWEFFRRTTVLLLCRDATLQWDTLYIDPSYDHRKALDSIRTNRAFDSNEIDENDLQHESMTIEYFQYTAGFQLIQQANDSFRIKF